ncbi:MAG: hypothetical protein ACTHN0_05100 [Aquihabitans sp.]
MSEQLNPLGLRRERHDGAVLLVSELVSDAVLAHHAPVVTLQIEPDTIVVGVEDPNGDVLPRDSDESRPDGMLDAMVDEFADRWGECYEPDGTHVVWFAIPNAA